MSQFAYSSTEGAKGSVLTLVASDNTITIVQFPPGTSFTANVLRTSPDPVQTFQSTNEQDAVAVINNTLNTIQNQ